MLSLAQLIPSLFKEIFTIFLEILRWLFVIFVKMFCQCRVPLISLTNFSILFTRRVELKNWSQILSKIWVRPSDLQIVQSISGNLIFFAKKFLWSGGSYCVKNALIIWFNDAILHAEAKRSFDPFLMKYICKANHNSHASWISEILKKFLWGQIVSGNWVPESHHYLQLCYSLGKVKKGSI